jgi:hypothetical protein
MGNIKFHGQNYILWYFIVEESEVSRISDNLKYLPPAPDTSEQVSVQSEHTRN